MKFEGSVDKYKFSDSFKKELKKALKFANKSIFSNVSDYLPSQIVLTNILEICGELNSLSDLEFIYIISGQYLSIYYKIFNYFLSNNFDKEESIKIVHMARTTSKELYDQITSRINEFERNININKNSDEIH